MTYWDGNRWIPDEPAAPERRAGIGQRLFGASVEAALITLLMFGLIAGTTLAARGVISVPDGVFGSTATATVNPGGDVYVRARCYQNGVHVYEQYVKVDSTNRAVLQLGPTPLWSGGAANCTAEEGSFGRNQRWHTIARTSFSVSD